MKQSNNWYLEVLFGMRDMCQCRLRPQLKDLPLGFLQTQSGVQHISNDQHERFGILMMLNWTMLEWISAVMVLALGDCRKPTFAMFAGIVIIAALRFAIA